MDQPGDGRQAIKISDHVYWVGAIDWGIRDFHGYATRRGSTYNAYLIMGEKIALVDTVKRPFMPELLARVASVVDPGRIDWIIANHAEMDHSGGLPEAVRAIQPEKVFASTNGVGALCSHFDCGHEITAVKDGESLRLGDLTLSFVEARMLHWPDSMATYLVEDKVLLSNDAFGMHLASGERFADQLPESVLDEEAARYYANILMPLSPLVAKLLEKVQQLGIEIRTVAPSHGPVWREPSRIVSHYASWSAGETSEKAVIVYDTMWGSTERMALAIAEGLIAEGVSVKPMPLKANHRSDVAAEMLDARALVIGSPTLNNNLFPTVADVLTYLKGLKPRNLVGAAFGSYGWSGEAPKQLAETLSAMKVELVGDPITTKYVPDGDVLQQCTALGRRLAAKVKERSGSRI